MLGVPFLRRRKSRRSYPSFALLQKRRIHPKRCTRAKKSRAAIFALADTVPDNENRGRSEALQIMQAEDRSTSSCGGFFNHTSHIQRIWLVLLFFSVLICHSLSAQPASHFVAQEFSLRVDNQSPSVDWHFKLASNGDTLFNGALTGGLLSIDLDRRRSYHVIFHMNDGPYSKDYYINGPLYDSAVILFTCNNDVVLTANPVVERYSEVLRRFTRKVWSTTTKAGTPMKAYAELSTLLAGVETELRAVFYSPVQQGYVRDSVVTPVRIYIDSLQTSVDASLRTGSRENEPVQNQASDFLMFRRPTVPLSRASLSNEAYMMIRGIAYASSYQLPKWFDSQARHPGRMLTIDIARRVLAAVGESCACEVAYGIFFRSSINPGADFTSCSDSLPRYLVQLAETDSSYFCGRLKGDMEALCSGLSRKTIESFAGTGRDSVLVNRMIDKDSVYLLHFWGTWCNPCIDGYDVVMSTADTLKTLGCKTIHIACENKDRFPTWREFVEKKNGEQMFTYKTQGKDKMLADQLAISSFPTLLVIGRGGEILARDIEIGKVTDFIRLIAK